MLLRVMRLAMMLICMSVGSVGARAADSIAIEQFTLKNGLEVIVLPNKRVPAISHMLWFYVGSADDPLGKSGLAHYLEHMMFKGTKRFPQGQYADIIARHGGNQNAFTGYDTTSYYVNIAKEHLPLVMELEADRLGGMQVTQDDVVNEREVVLEERRQRVDNNPRALLNEQMNAALYRHHPYRIPIIGWMHEMQTLSQKDVQAFFDRYYHINNAVLVVSGDITAKELKPLAQRYYGVLPAGKKPQRDWVQEPPYYANQRVSLAHENVRQSEWSRVYAAASFGSGDEAQVLPLFMLSELLAGGKTGHFYRTLVVEQKLASRVDTSYNGFNIGPSDFVIRVVPEQGITMEQIEAAVEKELQAIQKDGFSKAAMQRAKTQLKAESVYMRDGLTAMARIMGWIRMAGLEPEYFTRWQDMIDAVDEKDILQAASQTLQERSSVTGLLLPAAKETP